MKTMETGCIYRIYPEWHGAACALER
ncbi:hypothetical protein CBM2589_A70436 [Cupriavidus taiwanensis]|uniref:Uncharacterized protein n=1 Tax=Cupriavidus taiwanensis TaxID=164546 RepID=A0A375C863_9BURK|nr:hypothetical protein CBM2589_A70436 [Cupriavidus taiwanensis]